MEWSPSLRLDPSQARGQPAQAPNGEIKKLHESGVSVKENPLPRIHADDRRLTRSRNRPANEVLSNPNGYTYLDRCYSAGIRGSLFYYFGAMRIAPSNRMVSPLSMLFSMMCCTRAAYSLGWPSRLGNGTCWPRDCRAASGSAPKSGVSKIPGAMVTTRMPSRARSRANGKVIPTIPPFEAE